MFCKNCGKEIPDGSRLCSFCGAPVSGGEAVPAGYAAPRRRGGGAAAFFSILLALLIVGGTAYFLYFRTDSLVEEEISEEEIIEMQMMQQEQPAAPQVNWSFDTRSGQEADPQKMQQEQGSEGAFSDGSSTGEETQQEQGGGSSFFDSSYAEEDDTYYDPDAGYDENGVFDGTLLSTEERPTPGDFAWYETVRENGFWEGSIPIHYFEDIMGGWKALLVYDPEHTRQADAHELLNVDIGGVINDMEMSFDFYQMYWSNDPPLDETDIGKVWFYGGVKEDGSGFYLTDHDGIEIFMSDFVYYSGREYGFCRMEIETDDGGTLDADFLLVRP